MDPKETVRQGYDKVSHAYRADSFDFERSAYRIFLGWLTPRLEPGARVLDLGCGNGIPVTQTLAREFTVTGVDISPVQIRRARVLVPEATFQVADMTSLDFPPASFDAITAFYAIIHVPLEEQPALLRRMAGWLKSDGWLLATTGYEAWTGTEDNWRDVDGATMYWSHADVETYRAWLAENGLRVEREGFVPEGSSGHSVLLCRKRPPADPTVPVTVRQAAVSDAALLSSLNVDVQWLHVAGQPSIFKMPENDEFALAFMRERLQEAESRFFLAERQGEGIGYVYARLGSYAENIFRHSLRYLYVDQISVRPAYRSLGVGRRLLQAVEALAAQEGIHTIMLDSWNFNSGAQRFFQTAGYEAFNTRFWRRQVQPIYRK